MANLLSTTVNGQLNTGNVIDLGYTVNGSIATTAFRGINFHSFGDLSYYIGKPAGSWTQPLHIHFYTGIWLRSHHSYGGTRFYNIATGSQLMSVGDAGDAINVYTKITSSISSGTVLSHASMDDAIGWNSSYGTYIGSTVGGTYYIYGNGRFYDNGTIRTLIHSGNIGSQNVGSVQGYSAYSLIEGSRGTHSGSDFPNGTLVTTDINASEWAGDSFVMEVSGKSYSASSPFKLIMQGYLYADTVINVSAMSYGSYFPAPVKVMNLNGNLAFWWPRGSYWNSFEVHVRDAGGSGWNRVTGISDSVDPPEATKKVSCTPIQVIHTNNIGSQSVNYATSAGSATTATTAGSLTSMNISQFTNNSGYITSVGNITRLWAESHPTDYYVRANWTGSYWQLTSNHSSPVQVGYADNAGNSATTSQRDFSGDISTSGMGRFAGWYTGNAQTGLAAEIGTSGGQVYIIAYNRQSGAYGTLNLESTGTNLRISGSTVNVTSGTLQQGGNAVIHAGNIGSQSVSYATSAGSSSTADSAGSVDGLTLTSSANNLNPDNVTQNQIGYNTSVSLFGQTDGGLYSSAYSSSWIHQIYGDFRTGQIAIRGKNANTWGDWRIVVDDRNIGSYAVPYGNMTSSTGLNDNKLYLRTNGDNNHYIWNAADDWEEIVAYSGTGLRIKSSTGVTLATFTTSGNSMDITGNAATATTAGALTSMNISQFTNNSGYITSVPNLQYGGGDSLTGAGIATTWDPRGTTYDRYVIGNHTGISLHGYPGYGGVRLYAAGYPTLTTSVLRLEASDAVYTFGGLYSDGNSVIHAGNIGSQSVASATDASTLGGFGRGNTTNKVAYFDGSRNLYVNNPESYAGEVRLGAAWGRGGVYASSTLSLSTSGSQIHFVFGDSVPIIAHSIGQIDLGGSSTTPINITGASHKYLTINPGNGYEAMVRYIGGTGSSWYVGKRTSSQLIGTESLHFYSEAAGATVGGINPSGDMIVIGSYRLNNGFIISKGNGDEGKFNSWVQLGTAGFYSYTNSAHIYPNSGSYGSWKMDGTRNGWNGIEFGASNGNVSLMVNPSSNTTGFHNNAYGWQFYWEGGTLYCFKNAYGAGTQATVLDSSNFTSYAWPLEGSWKPASLSGSTRLRGATSPDGGEFGLAYSSGQIHPYADGFFYQNEGAYRVIDTNSVGSYAPTLTGGGASGSWAISVTGSAGGVAWGNVSSKPSSWLDTTNLIQGREPNSILQSGFYESYLGSGNPTGTWFNYINVRHSNPDNGHGYQIGMSYYDNNLWFRSYQGAIAATFQAWSRALGTNTDPYPSNMDQYVRTSDSVSFLGTTSPTILVNGHSDNTKGYRIHNTSGSSVSAMFTNSSNQLVIAAGAFDQINLNKKVLVNAVALGVNIAPSATAGRIDASNDIVAYSSSDERLKQNITPIANALDKVKSLTGVEFDWKPEYKEAHGHEGHDTGIIAQQVLGVMPTAVRTNDTGYLAVRYEKLIGLLIEGMKGQQAQIDELKAKLDGLTK